MTTATRFKIAPVLAHALARNWWMILARGLAAIAFGLLAFVSPGVTLLALGVLWGAYAIVDGIFALWAALGGVSPSTSRWWLAVVGVAGIITGVLTFVWPGLTSLALLLLIAVWAIAIGIMQIVGAIRLRREIDGEWWLILSGALSVLFGALMIAQPAAGAVAAVWMFGAFAIALGVMQVALALRLRKHKHLLAAIVE